MRWLPAALICLEASVCVLGGAVTAESGIAFSLSKDPRKWTVQHVKGLGGIHAEYVPEGDSIASWREIATVKIVFTKTSVQKYVSDSKRRVRQADSKADLKEETLADGSILLTCTSQAADESSIQRFIKGKDGIYMLAYHVRAHLKQEETFRIWEDIVRTASLVPNALLKQQ